MRRCVCFYPNASDTHTHSLPHRTIMMPFFSNILFCLHSSNTLLQNKKTSTLDIAHRLTYHTHKHTRAHTHTCPPDAIMTYSYLLTEVTLPCAYWHTGAYYAHTVQCKAKLSQCLYCWKQHDTVTTKDGWTSGT